MNTPKIFIIAGPNGSGKTTFAKTFLPQEVHRIPFLNADLIAAGLSPFAPEIAVVKAARLMLQEMTECSKANKNFAFETTLSGLTYIRRIKEWQTQGYHVSLFFLSLNSVDLAINRVKERVQQGGHDIPEDIIRRRFSAGYHNFTKYYCSIVNAWALYDNSDNEPRIIEYGGDEKQKLLLNTKDPALSASFMALKRAAKIARQIAVQTGTGVFVMHENGQLAYLSGEALQP